MKEKIVAHSALIDKDRLASQEKMTNEELGKAILAELVPIAKEVARLVAEADLPMGDLEDAQNDRPQAYIDVCLKIQQLLIEKNVRWVDRHFIFQLAMQPIDLVKDIVLKDLEKTFERKLSAVFGVSSFTELEMKQIDATFQEVSSAVADLKAEESA